RRPRRFSPGRFPIFVERIMLHRLLLSALAGTLLLAGAVRAENASKADAIVNKAIKAAGGEKNLNKLKAVTWDQKGTLYGRGDGIDYSATCTSELPDKSRLEIEGFMTNVVNGDKGWSNQGGSANDMSAAQIAEQKESLYARRLTTLVPLAKDKNLKLTVL